MLKIDKDSTFILVQQYAYTSAEMHTRSAAVPAV